MVATALARLIQQEITLHYTMQNIAELWNVMTRPIARNGFGLTVSDAEREVRAFEAGMILMPDSDAVYQRWRQIIVRHGISGVQVHDARLAASMYVHGVSHILTLNVARISAASPVSSRFMQTMFSKSDRGGTPPAR